jgi:hypothetical protein
MALKRPAPFFLFSMPLDPSQSKNPARGVELQTQMANGFSNFGFNNPFVIMDWKYLNFELRHRNNAFVQSPDESKIILGLHLKVMGNQKRSQFTFNPIMMKGPVLASS